MKIITFKKILGFHHQSSKSLDYTWLFLNWKCILTFVMSLFLAELKTKRYRKKQWVLPAWDFLAFCIKENNKHFFAHTHTERLHPLLWKILFLIWSLLASACWSRVKCCLKINLYKTFALLPPSLHPYNITLNLTNTRKLSKKQTGSLNTKI